MIQRRQFLQSTAALLAAYSIPLDTLAADGPRTIEELNAWFDSSFLSIDAASLAWVDTLDPMRGGPLLLSPTCLPHQVWGLGVLISPAGFPTSETATETLVRATYDSFRPWIGSKIFWRRRCKVAHDWILEHEDDLESTQPYMLLSGRMASPSFSISADSLILSART